MHAGDQSGLRPCPAPSLPAAEIERVVVNQIRGIADDKRIQADVLHHVERLATEDQQEHAAERRQRDAECRRCEAEIRRLSTGKPKRQVTDRLGELHEQILVVEERLRELRELEADAPPFDPDEIAVLFADFDAV
jgi:site-specific DNA recombinase